MCQTTADVQKSLSFHNHPQNVSYQVQVMILLLSDYILIGYVNWQNYYKDWFYNIYKNLFSSNSFRK